MPEMQAWELNVLEKYAALLAVPFIRAHLPRPRRQVHEWTEAELDYLADWYTLRGSAFIQARYPHITADGCRQMATRLNLTEDLYELTSFQVVAAEAGVSKRAVAHWVNSEKWRARVCHVFGRAPYMPAPLVRLYLSERRAPSRPRGWWGTARAAYELDINVQRVRALVGRGTLDAVQCGRTLYVDPHTAREWRSTVQTYPPAPHTGYVRVRHLAQLLCRDIAGVYRALQRQQIPLEKFQEGPRHALYLQEHHAQAFLSARAHHAEQVDTLIRKAQAIDVAKGQI